MKDEHVDENQMIMKITNHLEMETEIVVMKPQLRAAFDKIKELETKISKLTNKSTRTRNERHILIQCSTR